MDNATHFGLMMLLSNFGILPRSSNHSRIGQPTLSVVLNHPDFFRTHFLQGCYPAFLQYALPTIPFRLWLLSGCSVHHIAQRAINVRIIKKGFHAVRVSVLVKAIPYSMFS